MKAVCRLALHFLIAISAALATGGWCAAGDWPQLFGPNRNGVSTENGLVTGWGKEGPPNLWEYKLGAGFSGPVIAGNRVIAFHRVSDQEVVDCLDTSNAKILWTHSYATHYRDDFGFDEGPRGTPLIAGDRVYTLGAAGTLLCLEFASGKTIWQRSINQEYGVRKGFFGTATSPIIVDNRLLINVGGRDAGIVAFAADTGKELWKSTNDEASYSSPAVATIGGKKLAIFLTREGIVMLQPEDGKVTYSLRWRARNIASVNAATPLILGDHAFFSASYNTGAILFNLRPDKVEEGWKGDEVMSNHYTTCVPYRDFLFGCDGRQEEGARLRCIEWKTGKVRWTKEGFGCANIIVADSKLVIVDENGDLVLAEASADAYRELARATVLSKPARAPIALAEGRLYARDSRKLICLDLRRR